MVTRGQKKKKTRVLKKRLDLQEKGVDRDQKNEIK